MNRVVLLSGCVAVLVISACGGGGVDVLDAQDRDNVVDYLQPDSLVDEGDPVDGGVDANAPEVDAVVDRDADAATISDSDAEGLTDGFESDGDDDAVPSDAPDAPDADSGEEPGGFGWPCDDDSDCLYGPCIVTDDGRVCSSECSDSTCPEGFDCVPSIGSGGQAILVCMPRFVNLCRPCMTGSDCRIGVTATAAMECREFGAEAGSFCVAPCVDICPEGYDCRESAAGDGKSWCVPEAGTCGCSTLAVIQGAITACSAGVAGIESRCDGVRSCGIDGLSECSAPLPDAERCNGLDDDCDGMTDEAGAIDCANWYFDLDDDGYGLSSVARCLCQAQGTYRASVGGDCDDGNPDIREGAQEQCNEIDDDCDGLTDEPGALRCRTFYPDRDGDTWGDPADGRCLCQPDDTWFLARAGDCDDSSVLVFPGTIDDCNGIDDDCDGVTDPKDAAGCSIWYQDLDSDGYGNAAVSECLCAPSGKFTASKVGDCNDTLATVNPGLTELCNGLDDNCDQVLDPEGSVGCQDWFADRDGDGFGVIWDWQCLCRKNDVYRATEVGDCDDSAKAISPAAQEVCGNSIDENCNGFVSEPGASGCQAWFADSDQDGFGDVGASMCLCGPEAPYTTQVVGDCDDLSGWVSPVSTEVCANEIDDDCDGETDEPGCAGCVQFFLDLDLDGFGVPGNSQCLSQADPASGYVARVGGDCADDNNQVRPDAVERCNGIDDNCDGLTDPDGSVSCIVLYLDFDGDGFGLSSNSRCLCEPEGDYTAVDDGDCDDFNPKVGGGAEVCNGVDDNCNGRIDEENATGCLTWYFDDDGDGVGVTGNSKCLCTASGRYSTRVGGDCDDSSVSVRPGAADTCNGIDDDCDGITDPEGATGCQNWFLDIDGDGYGVTGQGKCLCAPGNGYVTRKDGDCNDTVRALNPAAVEFCNGLDDNCDGQTDPAASVGCSAYYADRDFDTWGNSVDTQCLCSAQAPWVVKRGGDCDDSNPLTGPGGVETCNGQDDDCDGLTDEYGAQGCVNYYLDVDRDGYGVSDSVLCGCKAEGLRDATNGGDCDDTNPAVNPVAAEICNGVDDNCDGQKDQDGAEGCVVYFIDRDSDGFGVAGDSRCLCAPTYPYTSLSVGDCDDTRAAARPGRTEQCNGFDDDCDGTSDVPGTQGCRTYYLDADADGWAIATDFRCLCAPAAPYLELEPKGDCDDGNPEVNKGKLEVCDGLDNDCNGTTDDDNSEGCLKRYLDADGDGWGIAAQSVCRCQVAAPYTATRIGDCNDGNGAIAPGKLEICNGFDDNCDGITDPESTSGCTTYFRDGDQDGYGINGDSRCLCAGDGYYSTAVGGDCNDDVPTINPGRTEICNNEIDDNCSGAQDEDGASGCLWYFRDADTDGYGDESSKRCLCVPDLEYKVRTGGDCCDKDDKVHPGNSDWQTSISACNTWDYNCDGRVIKRWNDANGGCGGWGLFDGCDLHVGWKGSAPNCGESKDWVRDGCGYCGFLWLTCCSEDRENRRQGCN